MGRYLPPRYLYGLLNELYGELPFLKSIAMSFHYPTAILVLAILIFVHEMGHFLIAKFFRVGVLEFAIGFGPKLFTWKGKETNYTLRAIPLGGFVRMVGDDPRMLTGEVSPEGQEVGGASPIEGTQSDFSPSQRALMNDESRWFLKQGYLAKCAIVFAGPLFNFLFAWVLAAALLFFVGAPEGSVSDGPVTIGPVSQGMPADRAGIKTGDRVKTVDGKPIAGYPELLNIVRSSGGKELEIVVERPGDKPEAPPQVMTFKVQPTATEKELDVLEGRDTSQATYRIGVGPSMGVPVYKPMPVWDSILLGGQYVADLTQTVVRLMKALVVGVLSPTKSIGGPISIIKQTAESAQAGLPAVLNMMILLNVSLGVMNLLPVPVLDGGHLTIFTIELLKGSRLSFSVQEMATRVGLCLLLLLMVFAIGNDIVRTFSIPWN
jgi:regulator of sigma E protease